MRVYTHTFQILVWFLLTKYLICSAVPLLVALVIEQAASFRVLNSSFFNMWINTGNICASITAWICWRFPAVIFDIVHEASFRIDSFSEDNRCKMWGNAPLFKITWVWTSSPVTMLPTARSAALTMLCESCLDKQKMQKMTIVISKIWSWNVFSFDSLNLNYFVPKRWYLIFPHGQSFF